MIHICQPLLTEVSEPNGTRAIQREPKNAFENISNGNLLAMMKKWMVWCMLATIVRTLKRVVGAKKCQLLCETLLIFVAILKSRPLTKGLWLICMTTKILIDRFV